MLDGLIQLRKGTVSSAPGFCLRFGVIPGLDEVLVSIFHAPASYTGEDMAEVSCHASGFIVAEFLRRLSDAGARIAEPGEFTRRAFLNGKIDLAQAEAVADLISSSSSAQHRLAFNQLRGGFSSELAKIREQLLELTTLMELELDFSEEEVEFADRSKLQELLDSAFAHCTRLADSFKVGNALRNGIPVAIIGAPNSGKSTLLNALLNDDRAIVSEIPGTTRDTVEETCVLGGILFRFIDTAGIRQASDEIERLGIERTLQKASRAEVVLGVFDVTGESFESAAQEIARLVDFESQKLIILANKVDISEANKNVNSSNNFVLPGDLQCVGVSVIPISAKEGLGLDHLKDSLVSSVGQLSSADTLVTNERHAAALRATAASLATVRSGLSSGLPTDLLAEDLRSALSTLGTITGHITSDEILGEIFGRFCIGK